jgi:DNA-directed RNA polymerase specialized sigma24 family protein
MEGIVRDRTKFSKVLRNQVMLAKERFLEETMGSIPKGNRATLPAVKQEYFTSTQAAEMLGIGPRALRARVRRAVEKAENPEVVELGGGITAIKFGVTWRFKLP